MSSSLAPQVAKVASLAHLHLDEEQVEVYQKHFENTLAHFESLQDVDIEGVEPMVTPHDQVLQLRDDVSDSQSGCDVCLDQAPAIKDRQFQVPPVV